MVDESVANFETRVVSANCVTSREDGRSRFHRRVRRPAKFKGPGDSQAPVHMMRTTATFKLAHRLEDKLAHRSGYHAIELPYVGSALSMIILLPDRDDGLAELIMALDATTLANPLAEGKPNRVDLRLPKFSVTSKVDLTGILSAQVPVAFSQDGADFWG